MSVEVRGKWIGGGGRALALVLEFLEFLVGDSEFSLVLLVRLQSVRQIRWSCKHRSTYVHHLLVFLPEGLEPG